MPADVYYADPVAQLSEQGVLAGTLCDDGFCPHEALDRKTMAVWVVRLLDGADPAAVSESRFADIDASSFHAPFVERMAEIGVTGGCGDGSRFCPDRTVSRAQMAVFLSRAYDLPEAADPGFSDVASDAWYAGDVARLAASGITQGCGDGSRFCPDRAVSRAQMAVLLWRAVNQVVQATLPARTWAIGESVSVGREHSCAVRADYTVTCWGSNKDGKSNAPAGKFLTVSAGGSHTCGVRIDRTVDCWGSGSSDSRSFLNPSLGHLQFGTASQPELFLSVSVSAQLSVSCGLKADQTILCWGQYPGAPKGSFLSVSTGYFHSCGVRTDETVACWTQRDLVLGDENEIYMTSGAPLHAPEGRFLSVSSGGNFACGVRTDQTVGCWRASGEWGPSGEWKWGTREDLHAPEGRFLSVSSALSYSCGVRASEIVECWGLDGEDLHAPEGRFLSVSSGHRSACGMRADETLECWPLGSRDGPPSGEFLSLADNCGIRSDDTLACWGVDRNNRFYGRSGPSGTFSSWSAQDSALRTQCGIRTDRTLACWDRYGEEEAVPSGEFLSIDSSGAARAHVGACAVRADQTVVCFEPGGRERRGAPEGRFLSVVLRGNGMCGVRIDQTVTCWLYGQDGYSDQDVVTEVSAPPGRFLSLSVPCGIRSDETLYCEDYKQTELEVPPGRFLSVDAAGTEACGTRADRTVTCWAYKDGRLTDLQDEAVPGRFLSVRFMADLSSDVWYRCGIRIDKTLACWGLGDVVGPPSGQYLAPIHRDGIPTLVWRPSSDFLAAAAAAGGEIVSAGAWHSCGVLADRTIACWGSNHRLRSSWPGFTGQASPESGRFLAVSSGYYHSCGLHADLSIRCWGTSGVTHFLSYPGGLNRTRVTSGLTGPFLSMSAGYAHSCGLRVDQTVICWGNNDLGEASAPAGQFLSVSAGGDHSCGVRADQTVICWGNDDLGEASAPAGQFLSVSAGGDHSCGVRVDQTVICWGNDDLGEASAPAGQFLSVSAGGDHSCGVRADQTVTCWGSNQDRHGRHIGQAEAPSGRFVSVTAGLRHSCALGTDGAVNCWGDNTSGWPIDEDECTAWTGGIVGFTGGLPFEICEDLSSAQRPPGQSDPPGDRFLVPPA